MSDVKLYPDPLWQGLNLWNQVWISNPGETKQFTSWGRKLTTPDAYHQIRNATEIFGPVGIGWGWLISGIHVLPNDTVAVELTMWVEERENTFSTVGQAKLTTGKGHNDDDCVKKALTDGITKGLSYLGFNADIFLGMHDNKYADEHLKMAGKREQAIKKEGHAEILGLLREGYFSCKDVEELQKLTRSSEHQGRIALLDEDGRTQARASYSEAMKEIESWGSKDAEST
jgi:hypothetical protein